MAATINKQEIIAKYGRTPNDTGSPEVQIALLTARISLLTDLKEIDIERYRAIIAELGLRK